MNEHIRIRRVVEGLRNHLKSEDFGDEFRSLIASYNNSCRQLKQRLEQVDAILLSGNVSGALKMAETDPSVLDLLTLLGFSGSQDLKDWCDVNGVSFEGRFDDTLIHRLNEAYSSNQETDTKLEKEYRKAILKKDYASALPIARTMARLQPNEAGAKTELNNTERRYAKQLESRLDAAIHGEDAEKTRSLLSEFDSLSCEDYAGGEALARARQIVQKENDQKGLERIGNLLEEVPKSPAISEWLEFEELYDEILEIKGCLSVELPPEIKEKWEAFSKLEMDFRRRVTRANSQRIALEKLKSVVEQARTDRITSKQKDLSEVQSAVENLLSTGRDAEALDVTIEPELQQRWQEEVLHLKRQVALMLIVRRRRRAIVGAISLIVLMIIGLTAYFFARSNNIVSQADAILASKDLSGARAFANANYSDGLMLGLSQAVKARHEKVRRFIATDEEDAVALEEKLRAFEGRKSDWSSDLRSMVFADGELKALYAAADGLSEESGRPIRLELDRLENELALIRNEFAVKLVKRAESKLSEIEENILPQLSLTNEPEVLRASMKSANTKLDELSAIDASGQEMVGLTEDQELRQKAIIEAVETASKAVEAHNRFAEKLENAYSIKGFNKIVSEGLSVDYIGSPYYGQLVDLPKSFDEASFRKMAFGKLPKVFRDLIGGDSLAPLSPPSGLLPKEVDAWDAFRYNEMVDRIQMHEISVPSPTWRVKIYSRGDLENDGKFSAGRSIKVTGSIYAPYAKKGQIRFVDYSDRLVSGLTSYGDLPELKMLKELETADILSRDFEVLSNPSNPAPFLRLVDQITEYKEASADYKCFAIVQLFEMMEASGRVQQWGLSYLPDWEDEVEQLKDLRIKNGDWLRSASDRKLAEARTSLSEFFDGASLEDLARMNRELVNRILDSKVKYHGYVDYDAGKLTETFADDSAFARSRDNGKWVRINMEAEEGYMPLSSVLSISPDLVDIYNQLCVEMDVDSYAAAQMANYLGIDLNK